MRWYILVGLLAICLVALISSTQGRYHGGYRRGYHGYRRGYHGHRRDGRDYRNTRSRRNNNGGQGGGNGGHGGNGGDRGNDDNGDNGELRDNACAQIQKDEIMFYHIIGQYDRRDYYYEDYCGLRSWDTFTDEEWQDPKLWRFIMHKWKSEVLEYREYLRWFKICRSESYHTSQCWDGRWNLQNPNDYTSAQGGSENTYCRVCNGALSEEDCILNGEWTECAGGQDGCTLEKYYKRHSYGKYSVRYNRRCSATCECGFRDSNFTKQDVKDCMPSTCAPGLGCPTYRCINDMSGLVKVPNAAYELDKNDNLVRCRCDAWCIEPRYAGPKDPTYLYPCCTSNCVTPCYENYNGRVSNILEAFCRNTSECVTTTMMMMGPGD